MTSPIAFFSVLAIAFFPAAHCACAGEPRLPANFDVSEIAPGNFVHYGSFDERSPDNLGDNANIGFIVGDKCVLAVDAGGSLPVGRALRQAIRRTTLLPVCYVVLTHVHPDHFFGAAAFLDDHPQFIAHENYPAQLTARARSYVNSLQRDLGEAAAGSEIVRPTLLVRQRLELDLGGRTIVVQAWPVVAAVVIGLVLAGSLIGGIAETQEMLDFCAKHKIVSDIELIPIQKINEAWDRLLKQDVKYRFVIDMASLKQ